MTIEKVTYQKAFATGPFLQEKIGIEIFVTPDDDADMVFKMAKDRVDAWHKEANPHLYQEETYPQSFPNPNRFDHITDSKNPMQVTYQNGAIPIISEDKGKPENTLYLIQNAPTLEILKTFKVIASSNPSKVLYNAYCQRIKELSI